jgi:hypothetical protein
LHIKGILQALCYLKPLWSWAIPGATVLRQLFLCHGPTIETTHPTSNPPLTDEPRNQRTSVGQRNRCWSCVSPAGSLDGPGLPPIWGRWDAHIPLHPGDLGVRCRCTPELLRLNERAVSKLHALPPFLRPDLCPVLPSPPLRGGSCLLLPSLIKARYEVAETE